MPGLAELPEVDLSASESDAARALDQACEGAGFMVLVGHGLSDADGRAVEDAANEVFEVDAEAKRRLDIVGEPNFRGYEFAGELEAFEMGRVAPDDGRPMCGANRWPESLSTEARVVLERHFDRCREITDRMTRLLTHECALGWQPELDPTRDPIGHLRLWRYPAGHIQLPAHADHGFFTLLLSRQRGLEIQRDDGSFVAAPEARGERLVVNAGRLLAHLSGGRYRATIHRVRSESSSSRFSMPFFHAPNDALRFAPPAAGASEPRTVGEYVHWGYTWQQAVNQGASVAEATEGAVEH